MENVSYANVVGCMMYAIVLNRPVITHDLSIVSEYMSTSGKEHWKVVKWIMRYLKGTLGFRLLYRRTNGIDNGM